jgi:hypothetical protein
VKKVERTTSQLGGHKSYHEPIPKSAQSFAPVKSKLWVEARVKVRREQLNWNAFFSIRSLDRACVSVFKWVG